MPSAHSCGCPLLYHATPACVCVQRVNGRVAMWGWANLLGPELSKHTPVAEQFGDAWVSSGRARRAAQRRLRLAWPRQQLRAQPSLPARTRK